MNRFLFAAAIVLTFAASSSASLTPSQLTPKERATYNSLASKPDDARHFLVTREYLRVCKSTTKANASRLPDIPADYDARFVSADEQKVVDDALDLSFAALVDTRQA
jgi:hypothetical protein